MGASTGGKGLRGGYGVKYNINISLMLDGLLESERAVQALHVYDISEHMEWRHGQMGLDPWAQASVYPPKVVLLTQLYPHLFCQWQAIDAVPPNLKAGHAHCRRKVIQCGQCSICAN